MTTPTSRYPCPICGSPATLGTGCPGCGAPGDQAAAEVIHLDGEIAALGPRVEQARQTYLALAADLHVRQARRAELAARVRARVGAARRPAVAPVPAAVPVPAVAPGPSAAAAPETSTRTVQNLLFVLGGLLLGTAAIVFTAVAWASVGIVGRAAILAGLTGLTLAVPLLAVRRQLTGTAETFAAVGLLLVVLDGYAAWTVDLAGVAGWPGTRYAALVGAVTVAVAVGYARLSRLRVPWFAALLAGQPVLPLAVADARPSAAGWALTLVGVALADLLVAARLARRSTSPAGTAGRVLAWLGYGSALVTAAVCALVALAVGEVSGTPLLAGVPLLVVVLALAGAGYVTRLGGLGGLAGALLALAAGAAVLRPLGELRPSVLLVGAGVTVALLTLAVLGTGRWLPAPVGLGTRVGALISAGLLAQVGLAIAGTLAAMAVARSVPPWQGATAGPELDFGWQVPVTLALVTAALVVLLPRAAREPVGTVGAAVVVLAAPAVGPTPWPVLVTGELVAGIVLLLLAVARPARSAVTALLRAAAGALLAGHALLVGLAAPGAAAAVLGALLLAGVTAVLLPDPADRVRRRIGGVLFAGGLLAGQVGTGVTLFALGAAPWWQVRGVLGAAVVLLGALLAVRRWRPAGTGYAAGALAGAVLVAGLLPLAPGTAEPVVLYASAGVLLVSLGLVRPRRLSDPVRLPGMPALLVAGGLLLPVVGVAVLPDVWRVLVGPYGWITAIWSGVPAGVGLTPGAVGPVGLPTGVALLLLAAATAGTTHGPWTLRSGHRPALALAAVALPVLLSGAGAGWPVVPVVLLVDGLALLLAVALLRPGGWLVPVGLALAAPGLAGLLATRAGSLGGLGLTVAVAVTVALAGRLPAARVAGWGTAVAAGAALAVTAVRAADLPLRLAGFAVLGVAVLALAGAAVLGCRRSADAGGVVGRRRVEARALDAAGHGTAVVALLLTLASARHAAAVCTLWGIAVGLRALWPGERAGKRWRLAAVAGVSELAALWLLLSAERVALLEAYTVPAALVVLGAGWLALRTRPALGSWLAYGPGLAAALLPSLASVLVSGDQVPRRLLLGAGALVVVLIGAVRRQQAPVLLGGATLAVLALVEAVRSWDLLPRWIYLAVGGFALIGLATSYERRRRDLRRLRSAVGRMS
ncbi:hypothetical protein V6U90_07230 [Micromonospora sp. CPCC 206060]|uniref:SCO7613 C-terminal domain-containing membrane protein n=1 Tax=Micromonospora sp. CPCC 206060 TaxID=3122406 RepID=UPI002FEF0F2C